MYQLVGHCFSECAGTVAWLKENWGITLLRCPMAVEAGGWGRQDISEVQHET